MAMDLLNYTPLGDKKNSEFFESYLPKVYERRATSGLDELVREMAAVVIQVEHGDAIKYLAELAVMGPYRLIDCRAHRHAPGVPAALAARVPAHDRARTAQPRSTRTRSPGGTSCTRCRSTSPTPATSARSTRRRRSAPSATRSSRRTSASCTRATRRTRSTASTTSRSRSCPTSPTTGSATSTSISTTSDRSA